MKPNEFKDMLSRTFHVTLTTKELTAIANYFPVDEGDKNKKDKNSSLVLENSDSENEHILTRHARSVKPHAGKFISNQAFLIHFNKIQREEQNKRRKERIQKERDLIESQLAEKRAMMIGKQQSEIRMLEHGPKVRCLVKVE